MPLTHAIRPQRDLSKHHLPQLIRQTPLPAMPPSTHRRTRARRAGSTPDHELPDSSPSRPRNKRRKLQELQETQEATPLSQIDQVNAVIASLAMPDPNPMVAIQHANDENFRQNTQGITAYAKVAGATWTYYVKELVIRIGRPPDARATGAAGSPTPPPQAKPDDVVHIDLGPSKLVSRNHATISYDQNGQYSWRLQVMGRNGLKVDDECYKKDSEIILRSGNIIEIGGVQMMFVLPDTDINIAAAVLRRSKAFQFPLEDDPQPQPTQSNESNYDTSTMPSSQNARPSSSQQLLPPISADPISQTEVAIKRENVPAYHRGLVLESTEDVDYADDSMKEVKPPFSYALMIAQAILSSEGEQLTLACIYQYIQDKYAFYRHSNTGWQNSIRHNLSLNKAFRKIPRRTDEPGKGMKWELLPEHRDEYIKKLQKPPKTGPGRQNSVPNSPSSPKPNTKSSSSQLQQSTNQPLSQSSQGLRLEDSQDLNIKYTILKHSPRSVTPPPITSYRVAPLEAYTPDRGSRLPTLPALRSHDKPLIDTSVNTHLTRRASLIQPANTNEMISSSQNHHQVSPIHGDINTIPPSPSQNSQYADDNPAVTAMTPAPQRQHPRLAPPSTGQLPSSYLPTSSPAPFWKYIHFGSTPAKPNDYSPLKDLHSSSPPPTAGRDESGHGMRERELGSPLKERGRGFRLGAGPQLVPDLREEDEDEDGMGDLHGIDLTRGFEKIGKFHMNGRIAESDWGA